MENKINGSNLPSEKMSVMDMYFNKESMETSMRVCSMLASSDLVPKEYQFRPSYGKDAEGNTILLNPEDKSKAIANCYIALNKAAQLGCDPLTVMQNMAIVYGRPSWSSSFLIGTVNTCGRFKPLKFKFGENGVLNETFTVYKKGQQGGASKTVNMPNYTCIAYTTERGSEDVLESAEISMRMAFEEGWMTKDGSKWITMPKQMLMYRAAAFWTRVYAPEISQGLYTAEESMDMGNTVYVPYEEVKEKVASDIEAPKGEVVVPQIEEKPSTPSELKQEQKTKATPGF